MLSLITTSNFILIKWKLIEQFVCKKKKKNAKQDSQRMNMTHYIGPYESLMDKKYKKSNKWTEHNLVTSTTLRLFPSFKQNRRLKLVLEVVLFLINDNTTVHHYPFFFFYNQPTITNHTQVLFHSLKTTRFQHKYMSTHTLFLSLHLPVHMSIIFQREQSHAHKY